MRRLRLHRVPSLLASITFAVEFQRVELNLRQQTRLTAVDLHAKTSQLGRGERLARSGNDLGAYHAARKKSKRPRRLRSPPDIHAARLGSDGCKLTKLSLSAACSRFFPE